ncbi:unnamed protein product [Musa acuminata subsp. malaccensis]|uniref:(wild Malaysian banana) hypothetical protein n=1 Tax=Musa acuminata subsp. malaccensis TaxID=214687 RepID=A0A804IQB2_MUSAM|nr:unnamed protein product [Musa acuminata subsp. malaccensis]
MCRTTFLSFVQHWFSMIKARAMCLAREVCRRTSAAPPPTPTIDRGSVRKMEADQWSTNSLSSACIKHARFSVEAFLWWCI